MLTTAALKGSAAGLAGVAAMTLAEKAEQRLTHRPNSYVPARTLLTLLGRRPPERAQPLLVNHLMHYGTGAVVGALRGVWSEIGLRGPGWSLAHAAVRLSTDQTLENATGVGAPPRTWPRQEHAVDVLHKAVYSLVTGALADRLVAERPRTHPGRRSH
jgi:hypothetical protein